MTFLPPRGPVYTHEPSNATHITADEEGRHLRDPYEAQFIEARKSKVWELMHTWKLPAMTKLTRRKKNIMDPIFSFLQIRNAGRGVFLKRDVPKGTVRVHTTSVMSRDRHFMQMHKTYMFLHKITFSQKMHISLILAYFLHIFKKIGQNTVSPC